MTFQFTPLPGAVLSHVSRLEIDLTHTSLGVNSTPVWLYNWQTQKLEQIDVSSGSGVVDNPRRFLGPQNAVIVQLNADSVGGYLSADELSVQQEGGY